MNARKTLIKPKRVFRFVPWTSSARATMSPAHATRFVSGLARGGRPPPRERCAAERLVTVRAATSTTPKPARGGVRVVLVPSRRNESRPDVTRCSCVPPGRPQDDLRLDRGSSDRGAGLGNDAPQPLCPVCAGTGWKPCGQCDGTGVNQDDLFGGKFVKGGVCWLCDGKAQTMCGNCVDLTDSF